MAKKSKGTFFDKLNPAGRPGWDKLCDLELLCQTGSGGDFSGEIVDLLLDALALLKANGVDKLHGAAQRLGSAVHILLDRDAAVLDERLLQEAVLLEELVHLAGGDLLLDLQGLGGHLLVVVHLGDEDLLLFCEHVFADLALIPEARVQSGDLHGDILADHGRVDAAGDLEVDEDADLAARMDVSDAEVLREAGKAADLDVLGR